MTMISRRIRSLPVLVRLQQRALAGLGIEHRSRPWESNPRAKMAFANGERTSTASNSREVRTFVSTLGANNRTAFLITARLLQERAHCLKTVELKQSSRPRTKHSSA